MSASPASWCVSDDGDDATGLYAELNGADAAWWSEVRIDLRNEPSGIASAVFDAAPVTVYDVSSSPLVSPRLAALVGAQSGAWVPMIAEERVIGVLVFASTESKRTFAPDELSLLQALASEAGLALERLRSEAALSDALRREQRAAEIVRRIRAQLEPAEVVRVAREELRSTLRLDEIAIAVTDGEARVRRSASCRSLPASSCSSTRSPTRSTPRCTRQRCWPRTGAGSTSRRRFCTRRRS